MVFSRRILLKRLTFASAGVILVPAFITCSSRRSIIYHNIILTEDQDKLISLITQTLIPKTKTPGASEVSVHEYCVKMIDDCLTKKDQEKFLAGLAQFNELSEKINKKEFTEMEPEGCLKFLSELDKDKTEDSVNFFFKTMKRFTLRGYTTSEYFLTNVQGYKMIPGKYKGCVPLDNPS